MAVYISRPWEAHRVKTRWQLRQILGWCRCKSRGPGTNGPLEARKRQGRSLLRVSEGTQLCWHFIFGLLASRTVTELIAALSSHPACGVLLWRPLETNTPSLRSESEYPLLGKSFRSFCGLKYVFRLYSSYHLCFSFTTLILLSNYHSVYLFY